MEKKNNKLIIILLSVIIFILGAFCILLATNKISFNFKNDEDTKVENNQNNNEDKNEDNDIENNEEVEIDYSAYNGTWLDNENEISIFATDEGIKFSWALHRIATIDEVTIPFENGKGIFYLTDYNEFTRKATIELGDNGVNIIVEDVSAVDTNYIVLDEIPGGVYIESGTYNYSLKADTEQNINDDVNVEISMDNVTVSTDAEHGNIFITGTINLSYDNNKYQGVGLSGYCLGSENEKYLITGPTDGRALFHNDENKNLTLTERIPSSIEYPDGKIKDRDEVNWDNVKIKYCKIDKMKAVLISDGTNYLYSEIVLNVEKNFE